MMALTMADYEGDYHLGKRTEKDKLYAKELAFSTMRDSGLKEGSPKLKDYSPACQKEYLLWLAKQ